MSTGKTLPLCILAARIFTAAVALATGASAEDRAVVWVEDPYAWVEKKAAGPSTKTENVLSTAQAVNEREHASFVLKAQGRLESVQVKVSPLMGPGGRRIEPDKIQVQEVKWLTPAPGGGRWQWSYVSWVTKEPMPELIEDVVAPLRVEQGEARHIWLTVSTHGVAPGKYEGKVDVTTGADLIASIPLKVTVWDIRLPLHPSIVVNQWESLPGPSKLAEKYGAFAREHYDNMRLINYPNSKNGEPDWNHWDWMARARAMGKYKMKVVIDLRRMPLQFAGPVKARPDLFVEKHTGVPFDKLLKGMYARLIEAGVPQGSIYINPFDEVETMGEPVLATLRNIKTITPGIKTMLTTGGAKDIIAWFKEKNGRFAECQRYIDSYMIDKAVFSRAFELDYDAEAFRQLAGLYRKAIPLEGKYGFDALFEPVAKAARLDPDTEMLRDWFRGEQKKGKEIIWYWNHWRSAMVKDNRPLYQGKEGEGKDGRRIPGILEAERFSLWKTWAFDVDGGTEGSATGIWYADWTYFDKTIEINEENFSTERDREWSRKEADSKPVFTWQPPEKQMLHLVEHVRVLPDGDFRMVSSKRNEALADGARDCLYLGSLEQLARRALSSGNPGTVKAGQEALAALSMQYMSIVQHPYHLHTYQAARRELAKAILNLQDKGLLIETDGEGGLIRHRRYRPFSIDGSH